MHDLIALEARLAPAAAAIGARSLAVRLVANRRPWHGTGLRLRRGESYTLLASGRIRWSARHPHLHGGPGFHLWARVKPGGRIVNVTRDSGSFVADVDGELELGIYLGMWRDEHGALDTPQQAYDKLGGTLDVCVLAWPGDAADGLDALLASHAAPALLAERERLAAAVTPPAGWHYLVETGTSDIWRACGTPDHGRICLDAHDDQGIIRTALDIPLEPATTLAWRWRLDEHPSGVAEDSTLSHDYVSIALEFDDGRDLTWIWSSCLPLEQHFACPIRAWSARETHLVVRSGFADAGRWVEERRDVYADVARALGTPPRRIVAAWLIAVATFQHGRARAAFEAIRVLQPGLCHTVS